MAGAPVFVRKTVAGRSEIWAASGGVGPIMSLALAPATVDKIIAGLERAWSNDVAWLAGRLRTTIASLGSPSDAARLAGALATHSRLMPYGIFADGDDLVTAVDIPRDDLEYARSFVEGFQVADATPVVALPVRPPLESPG